MLLQPLEFANQRRPDAEHAGVDAVVVADVLADVGDLSAAKPDLGRIVEVEAALDVVVDAESACAFRHVEARQATHDLRRIEVVRHGEDALLVDVLFGGEKRDAVFAIETFVDDEMELESEGRLRQKRLLDLVAAVADDDDRLADPFPLQGPQHTHQERRARHGF